MAAAKISTIHRWDVGRIAQLVTRPNWPRARSAPKVDLQPQNTAIGRDGFVVLPGLISPDICDAAVAEYHEYERRLLASGINLRDEQSRNYRLTNFHLVSRPALDIACHPRIHQQLDEYFGRRSMVYTSLYFKHGSQQKPHIDTPFFVSNPIGWFAGVWVALEDVNPEAGPVQYFQGAHRLFDTEEKLRAVYGNSVDVEEFFDRVAEHAARVSALTPALLKKGDVLIWHHGLPHGGQRAVVPHLTRHSLVIHMGAEGVNLHYEGLFERRARELPRYGMFSHNGRSVARVSLPRVMY